MIILAIDPGPKESAWVLYDANRKEIRGHGYETNEAILARAFDDSCCDLYWDRVVVEWIEGYGLTVGKETFDTCRWVGRFEQASSDNTILLGRKAVKSHLCNTTQARDRDIRMALIDRFGEPGTKKKPGPTYGVVGDEWSALAVAVTWADTHGDKP